MSESNEKKESYKEDYQRELGYLSPNYAVLSLWKSERKGETVMEVNESGRDP